MLKKQLLTREVVKKALLKKLNKNLPIIIFFSVLSVLGGISAIAYDIDLLNGTVVEGSRRVFINPAVTAIIGTLIPILFVIIVWILLVDFFRVLTDRFYVCEEELIKKDVEFVRYYRRTAMENSFYFSGGRLTVEDELYENSMPGERFFVVTIGTKNVPRLAFHTASYILSDELKHKELF